MSQFPFPGVQQEYTGASYLGTPGIHVPESGGVATKAVALSELTAAQSALQTVISQLEASLAASISAGDSTLQSEINNLNLLTEAQVSALISAAIAGGVRYQGTATADATNPATATGTSTFANGDLYRVSSNGTSAFGFALNTGDYVLYNGTGWDKIDSTDPSVSAGDSVIVVTQVGDGQYQVKIAEAFLTRITGIETNLASEVARATAAETALSAALTAEEADRTADQIALQDAIDAEATTRAAAISTASAGLANEAATRASADSALLGGINSEASARQSAVATINAAIVGETNRATGAEAVEAEARIAGDAALLNAIQAESTQRQASNQLSGDALAQEVSDRAAADGAINVALTDAQATIATHSSHLTALDNQVVDRTTHQETLNTIAQFYSQTHIVRTLGVSESGVFDNTAGTTTFYVSLPVSVNWAVVRLSEKVGSYQELARPMIEYVARNDNGSNGFYARITFFHSTQVPDNTIKAFLVRFFDQADFSQVPTPELVQASAGSGSGN